MCRQLHLLQLQVYRFVDPIDKLIHARINRGQDRSLLIDLKLELSEQILIECVLGRLHLVE